MSKNLTGIALVAVGLMLAPAVWAQDAQQAPAGPPPGPPPMHEHGRMNAEHQLRHLTRELNLNSDQQAQFSTILGQRDSQMQAIRANAALPPREMHKQMHAIMADSDAKMRAALNPDQQQKFDAMRANQRERMEERRDEGGPPPPPQPPAPPQQ
jgi:protein CpxP